MTSSVISRATATVLRHAQDAADAGELLAMLGLVAPEPVVEEKSGHVEPSAFEPLPVELTPEPAVLGCCKGCSKPMVSSRVFRADRRGWRLRGYLGHAGHGECTNCRSARDERERRARARAVPDVQPLLAVSDQLTALRQVVRGLRMLRPADPHLAALRDALAAARTHLNAARAEALSASASESRGQTA